MRPFLQDLSRDLRFAIRLLLKDRWLTLVAALTLGVGIGSYATVFTIASGMGLRGLPADEPDRVVSVASRNTAGRGSGASYADFEDWRGATTAFTGLAAHVGVGMNVTDPGQAPDLVSGVYISANAFQLLGERPILGRDFLPEDDRPGAPPVVILGYSVWKNRYDGDRAMIGRTIGVSGVTATVVGVMREGFRFPLVHDLWQPLATSPGLGTEKRDSRTLQVFGRLADGIGISDARSELNTIADRLSQEYPETNKGIRVDVQPFTGSFNLTNPWHAMIIGAVLVVLIGCANVSNLLLARSAHRSLEIAIRASLGATRWQIVRQLMVESLLLATLAGALGFGLGQFGVYLWELSLPIANWPYWYRWTMDARVVVYVTLVSLATAFVFGIAPALHVASTNSGERIAGGRSGTPGVRARRWTSGLLVAELALTLSLLAGAGLSMRTLAALYRADAVVDTSNLLLASLNLPPQHYSTPEQRVGLFERVEARFRTIPLISAAAVASALPFYNAPVWSVQVEGDAPTDPNARRLASYVSVGDRYFDTLGLPLLRGRQFTNIDGTAGHEAAIVNQRFASMYFADRDPVGERLRLTNPNAPSALAPWLTVVGVSPTVRQHYAQEIDPVVYMPYRSNPGPAMTLIVRGRSGPAAITPLMRDEIRALDPDLPLFNIMPLDQLLSGTRFANRVYMTMLGVFAGIALVLSAVGLYAMTAYSVTQRTREIGVRIALGGQPSQLVWLFVRRVVIPLGAGLVVGLAGAFGVGRLVRGMLIQTSPHDPLTLLSISLLLVAVAFTAAFCAASRAARLDPIEALRHE